ncbi:MAG: hypothetical protein CVU41_00965 [Chloroflexi bacterium HGW-Chloroflexi-3]|nr:MAG: hypothetical protein CVU41_00965 [Chloroflexi bacterium HGW-Chloroflexi-3]
MGQTSFNHSITKIFQNWWLLLIGGIIGGFIAYLTSIIFMPAIFVAQAEMSVVINFKEVGHLSQYEQDQMIGNIISLFQTNEVLNNTISNIDIPNLDVSNFKKSCFIERQVNSILFRCQSTNPKISTDWANQWAIVSHEILSEAYIHALNYESLMRKQLSFENCVQWSYFTFPTPADCLDVHPDNMSIDNPNQMLQHELLRSKNIFPGIKFSDVIPAEVPQKASRFQTNSLVLSGSFFGFLISFLFLINNKYGKN